MLITSSFYIVQFSRFALPTAFAARSEDLNFRSSDPTTTRCLVGPSGLEPPTLRLSVVRSSQLSYGPVRRHKLHITRRTASSTSRSFRCVFSSSQTRFAGLCSDFGRFGYYIVLLGSRKSVCFCGMVEIVGIEPATSCLQGRRSPS